MWCLSKSKLPKGNSGYMVGEYDLEFSFGKRFALDSTYFEDENVQFLLDSSGGALLNKKEYVGKDFELLPSLYEDKSFYKKFNGVFTGLLYYKATKELIVFVCQNGMDSLFYSIGDGLECFSNDYGAVAECLKKCGKQITVDLIGLNNLYSLGFVVGDRTLAAEIQQLEPGECMKTVAGVQGGGGGCIPFTTSLTTRQFKLTMIRQ